MKSKVLEFVIACLNDEHGISESALDKLMELEEDIFIGEGVTTPDSMEKMEWKRITSSIKGTNGRFYISL